MKIDLSPIEEAEIRGLATAAGYESPERYLKDIALDAVAGIATQTDSELKASLAMIDKSMAEIDAGEGRTIEEAREALLGSLREEAG